MIEWKDLAVKLASAGLPVLGRAIGGIVGSSAPIVGAFVDVGAAGENIGAAAARMLAEAFGVPPTPDAIVAAIDNQPTTEVMAKLQATEEEAKAKWPALALIAQAEEETARIQITSTADVMKNEVLKASELPEGNWRNIALAMNSLWRPLFALELLLECFIFSFGAAALFAIALIKNEYADIDAALKMMPLVTVFFLPYMAARFGLVGYHMNLRTREKEAVTEAVTDTKPVSLDEVKKLLKASGVKIK